MTPEYKGKHRRLLLLLFRCRPSSTNGVPGSMDENVANVAAGCGSQLPDDGVDAVLARPAASTSSAAARSTAHAADRGVDATAASCTAAAAEAAAPVPAAAEVSAAAQPASKVSVMLMVHRNILQLLPFAAEKLRICSNVCDKNLAASG
jgi:hypothetical protein